MTLGIGVLCNHGETMVLGSEQRASYFATGNVQITPNDEAGKQFYLKPHRLFVSIAGSMSLCHAVYAQFAHTVLNLKDQTNMPPELLMHLLDAARSRELRRMYSWQIKKKMGITLEQWAAGKLRRGLKMNWMVVEYGLTILENTRFKCELIVGGFTGQHGIFLKASEKDQLQEETSPGVYAIGGGQVSAMPHFSKRGQNVHMSLTRTLLHVYEALHISQSQYVGPPPEFLIVLRKRDLRVAVFPTVFLEDWRKKYESERTTAVLDDSSIASKLVLHQLRELRDREDD